MSTTTEINAYLSWRAEREGKLVDVSPEAFHKDQLTTKIQTRIESWLFGPSDDDREFLGDLGELVQEYQLIEEEN